MLSATEECERCEHGRGFCKYDPIYDVDGVVKEWNFTCQSAGSLVFVGILFLGNAYSLRSYSSPILFICFIPGFQFLFTIFVIKILKAP